jgi:hypothetical protein
MAQLRLLAQIAVTILLSVATSSPTEAAQNAGSPPAVSTHVEFPDFEWVRQRYQQDAPSRAAWAHLLAEARAVAQQRTRAAIQATKRHGVTLQPPSYERCYGDDRCDWILQTERVAQRFDTWQAFSQAWTEARPVVTAVSLMAAQAEDSVRSALPGSGFEKELHVRFTRDQLLRRAYSDQSIPLSEEGRQLFLLVVSRLIARADHDNTAWLRQSLAASEWPRSGQLRSESEMAAWFMLVHARDDPAFQLQVLDRMAEVVEKGELGRAQHATRVDHILLEVTGLQRYGTQGACEGKRFLPRPTEAPDKVPELRRQMGLPTLQEQEQLMSPACTESP